MGVQPPFFHYFLYVAFLAHLWYNLIVLCTSMYFCAPKAGSEVAIGYE